MTQCVCIGVVQTAYANGNATAYLKDTLVSHFSLLHEVFTTQ